MLGGPLRKLTRTGRRALPACAALLLAACAPARPPATYPCDAPPPPGVIRIDGPCAWTARAEALVAVDGTVAGRLREYREGTRRFDFDSADVRSIELLSGPEAVRRFGEEATHGVLLITTAGAGRRGACTLDGVVPEVIPVAGADPSEWHGRFDLADAPYLWEPAEPDEVVAGFRDDVRARLGAEPDSRWLIERQRAIFAAMPAEWSGEAVNSTLLLEGRAGAVAPIGCLEAMLWKWQAARFPMLDHPTEFGAFVLRGQGQVRVYLSSADLVGQRIRDPVTQRVAADVAAGYRLVAHLHNHPFLFDREVGDRMWTMEGTRDDVAGALAPSMTDVQFYRRLRESHGLEGAWITNGIETSRFHAGELSILSGR